MLPAADSGWTMFPDVLPLIAGLGLFMLGMKLLEDALAALAGLPLRRFLREHADRPARGMLIGAAATAILQSSTLVSLLVLAFVGAGIMQLAGAVGVIMGANLGTTLTTWLVASLGFRLDLAAPAMAFIGVGGVGFSLLRRSSRVRETAGLLLGIGLLLYGLDLMKSGVQAWASAFDVAPFADLPLVLMALLGVAVTGAIQSSTAAMMIALGALQGGLVDLPTAAAFAAGTGVGTTFTAVLGALGGSADKKRVAATHLGFNLFKATLALLILHPMLAVLGRVPGLVDPLLRLAAFHTTINLAGIAVVLPFAGRLAGWLGRRFRDGSVQINHYLHAAGREVPEAGLEALRREVRRALGMTISLNREVLRIPAPSVGEWPDPDAGQGHNGRHDFDERYRRLKRLEGEIVEYVALLQLQEVTPEVGRGLSAQLEAMRMAVSSAKALKDIRGNLVELRLALQAPVDARLEEFEVAATTLYAAIDRLAPGQPEPVLVQTVSVLRNEVREAREEALGRLYREAGRDNIGEEVLSTLLNVNRALYLSAQSLLRALGLHLLAPETAGVVEDASLD
jgi:phosphate:Na+ symporter